MVSTDVPLGIIVPAVVSTDPIVSIEAEDHLQDLQGDAELEVEIQRCLVLDAVPLTTSLEIKSASQKSWRANFETA